MANLVLLRHGESLWNARNLFTGWTDIDLSGQGYIQARTAGEILLRSGIIFDLTFTSVLKRAIRTLWLVLEETDQLWLPVSRSWRLNERHYGALQGLNKAETALQYGERQVHLWRRSYQVAPPGLLPDDERYPGHDRRYAHLPTAEIPRTESLRDTWHRLWPYWHSAILPMLAAIRDELDQQKYCQQSNNDNSDYSLHLLLLLPIFSLFSRQYYDGTPLLCYCRTIMNRNLPLLIAIAREHIFSVDRNPKTHTPKEFLKGYSILQHPDH